MVRSLARIHILLAMVALLGAGCGGGRDSVSLVWKSQAGELGLDAAAGQAPVYQTLVYVSNDTGSLVRDARLRFQPGAARNAPAGFRVGTVTPISSSFEGPDQLWSVGNLQPGARIAVPIGLWFDFDVQARQAHPVELSLALISPDLDKVVESNHLTINLSSP
jgi:hypothetical protein